MPQNIQKRLLLYVLQQLSLFSEIDLPNLEEVSLNNIVLRNVSLDPEKVGKLPGFNLRYGQVGTLELNGGVMGGVNIDASDIEIVVAPSLDNHDVQFSLAQSTANLASMMETMEDDGIDEDNDTDVEDDSGDSKVIDSDNDHDIDAKSSANDEDDKQETKRSALGGVMAKAVEIALQKLQVTIKNLVIKVVLEEVDIAIKLHTAHMKTTDGVRQISVEDISVFTLKPGVPTGDKSLSAGQTSRNEEAKDEETNTNDNEIDEIDENEGDDNEGENDDNDYDSNNSNDSNEGSELMDSMVFTHDEASSIYMSATSRSFSKNAAPGSTAFSRNTQTTIAHIDSLSFTFKGLSSISDINIDVGNVKVATIPATATVVAILSSLTRNFKLRNQQYRKQDLKTRNDRFPQYTDDDEMSSEESSSNSLFEKLHISSIAISTSSALDEAGNFLSSSHMALLLSNINILQRDNELIFGGVEKIHIYFESGGSTRDVLLFREGSDSINRKPDKPRADLRFEYFISKGVREITFLMSKPCHIKLDSESLLSLLGFFYVLSDVQGATQQLSAARHMSAASKPVEDSESDLTLQTATFTFELVLDEISTLSWMVFPISFSSKRGGMTIDRIVLTIQIEGRSDIPLISMQSVEYKTAGKSFTAYIRSGHNPKAAGRTTSVDSSSSINIAKVSGLILHSHLTLLSDRFRDLVQNLDYTSSVPQKSSFETKADLSMSVSHYASSRRRGNATGIPNILMGNVRSMASTFSLHIEKFRFLLELDDIFGSLELLLDDILVFKSKDEIHGSVLRLLSARKTPDKSSQYLLSDFTELESPVKTPLILFNVRNRDKLSALDIHFNRLKLEYHASWVSLLKKFQSQSSSNEKQNPSNTPKNALKRFDLYLTFNDCALAFNPGRLRSKCIASIEKCTSDVRCADSRTVMKSTLKEVQLYVIDDVSNRKKFHSSLKGYHSEPGPLEYFSDIGYIPLGTVTSLHVAVSSAENPGGGAKLEIKVNADELQLEVCADSAHTLTQLLNDMTDPISLQEHEKCKVKTNETINLLSMLDEKYMLAAFATDDEVLQIDQAIGSLELVDSELSSGILIQEDHFASSVKKETSESSKIDLTLNLGKAVIYLYDGYDWKLTRKGIKSAIRRVEQELDRSEAGQNDSAPNSSSTNLTNQEPRVSFETGAGGVIEETLYKSIHLSVPTDGNVDDLAARINDQVLTDKKKTTPKGSLKAYQNLHLRRSTHHKMMVEVLDVSADVKVFSTRDPNTEPFKLSRPYELMNSIDLKLHTCNIVDNVPSSTWNKFLTYMNILGKREQGTHMARLNLVNVRPDPSLIATEAMIDLEVLPLRMYIDQDTLDFLNRFLDFRDVRFDLPPDEILYIQKFSLGQVRLKLDYKPKSIDYTGMRSGNASEFMNIFVLDGSDLELPRTVLYGIPGIPKLGMALGRVWGPVIQQTQLAGLLSGISPLKSFVSLGGSFKDLVAIPIAEYKKDGRLANSVRKGTFAFAKSTTAELLRLGAKLTSGTQVLLEQSEQYLGGQGALARNTRQRLASVDEDEGKFLYAVTTKKAASDLMAKSQLLQKRATTDKDMHKKPRSYLFAEIDESGDFDPDVLHDALVDYDIGDSGLYATVEDELAFDETLESDTEVAGGEEEKLTSLYSNQPVTSREGIRKAYQSMGRNLGATGNTLTKLKEEIASADNVPDSLAAIAKSSPILLMRPIIGTTEALLKVLMGLSNEIDDRYVIENKDKYKEEG